MSGDRDGLQVGYLSVIPAIAVISGLLGLLWNFAVLEAGWTGFPPDLVIALIIVAGSALFFLTHALPFMRRPLRISQDSIELPTPLWQMRSRVTLSSANPPRVTLFGTQMGARCFSVGTGKGDTFFPLPFGKRGTERLRSYLHRIQDGGKLSILEHAGESDPDFARLIARSTAIPAVGLVIALVFLAELVMGGIISVALAGNTAGLLVVALYSIAYLSSQNRLTRRFTAG